MQTLESESIAIIREAVATTPRPIMLWAEGKDSAVLLHLARKAFYPHPLPLPLLYFDGGRQDPELTRYRSQQMAAAGAEWIIQPLPSAAQGTVHPETICTALSHQGVGLVLWGFRGDEGRHPPASCIHAIFTQDLPVPAAPRPAPWGLYNTHPRPGEILHVFPLAQWTERDVWLYIKSEGISIAPLYLAAERWVARNGSHWLLADPQPQAQAEHLEQRRVRVPTLSTWPPVAVESHAQTLGLLLAEVLRPYPVVLEAMQGQGAGMQAATSRSATDAAEGHHTSPTQLWPAQDRALRLILCGNVHEGKSALIESLAAGCKRLHAGGGAAHLSSPTLLITGRRHYRIAEVPGHPQALPELIAAAATADLALVLVDARTGLSLQTRQQARILAMLGLKDLIVVVNRIDLIDDAAERFTALCAAYRDLALTLDLRVYESIPISALTGDNIHTPSPRTPWYTGPTLWEALEGWVSAPQDEVQAFRLPVQWVKDSEPGQAAVVYGRIAEGQVGNGTAVRILPSGLSTRVAAIWRGFAAVESARAGEAIALCLADASELKRGDVLVAAEAPAEVADQFEARLLWLDTHPLIPERQYLLKLATQDVRASVTALKYREDPDTGAHLAARTLNTNELATVNLATQSPLVFAPYQTSRQLGGFILIDPLKHETVGVGTIDFALRRATNIHWQALQVDRLSRARLKHQTPCCLWFTGLSGSGKSTLANLLDQRLHALGRHTYVLDGDNVRHGLNRDLGFTEADRVENIRRVAEVAKLMVDAGLIVLVSFISPFRSERQMARTLFSPGEFIEIYVDTPLEECERRDVKGLYAKARAGLIKNFTGIDSPYEPPEAPELHLRTAERGVDDCLETLLGLALERTAPR
ncbi:adenylyl-sulfate kinase [Caldichromatium japonicum]|uniref:Adenylyl-sulfate kinase n=1 Tax=Caldichromatium japonicum TaxID=2699430 RepID=A0A6G7VDP8_9GAMM|nr:adenylyl-sulfate kinase [Caldichromatium japonicum]QIK37917.1 adenylyl-sulfate kinase [Caldichromatium japonicum]